MTEFKSSSQTTRSANTLGIVSLVVIAFYVLVTSLFVLPANLTTQALGGLRTAAAPYFQQEWNVFAPNVARTNPELRIQAQWYEGSERVYSDWVSITAIEMGAVRGHPLPSRVQKSSWNALSRYYSRYSSLTTDQKILARDTFVERKGDRFRAKRSADLIKQFTENTENQGRVVRFLRYDNMMKEYATSFAAAYFEQDVVRVRWQILRERPNEFEHRFETEPQFGATEVTFGWRHVDHTVDPKSVSEFRAVIERYGGDLR